MSQRYVTIFVYHGRHDVRSASTAVYAQSHADARSPEASSQHGGKEQLVVKHLYVARKFLSVMHENSYNDDCIHRFDAELEAQHLKGNKQQYAIDYNIGYFNRNASTPEYNRGETSCASCGYMVRQHEHGPSHSTKEQTNSNHKIVVQLFPHDFPVNRLFHIECVVFRVQIYANNFNLARKTIINNVRMMTLIKKLFHNSATRNKE